MLYFINTLILTLYILCTYSNGSKEICQKSCSGSSRTRLLCGTDGVTYNSRCHLRRARLCSQVKVYRKHGGPCNVKRCNNERDRILRENSRDGRFAGNVYLPVCEANGDYKKLQCFRDLCWCVNRDGDRPDLPTSTTRTTPHFSCSVSVKKERRGTNQRNRGKRRKCKRSQKPMFNYNLMIVFSQEYHRKYNVTKNINYNIKLKWKFTDLDKNKDGFINKKELRPLKLLIRNIIKPKTCAHRFHKYCDKNKDKRFSLVEWRKCLGVSKKGQKILPNNMPLMERKSEEVSLRRDKIKNCRLQKANAIPKLRCRGDHYLPLQCYKNICFCVNTITGENIRGSGLNVTYNKRPDCSSIAKFTKTSDRSFRGCRNKRRERFLQKIADVFYSEMDNNERPKKVFDDKVILKWKFKQMDKNNNNILERKEIQRTKKNLLKIFATTKLKSCSKRFVRFCDANRDYMITEVEWLACSLKTGINPIERYLKNN